MKPYQIPEIAKKYVDYDMIQMHTELPEYPDSRTRLLFAFLNNGSHTEVYSELYALVVSLVQLGLDTHDLIDTGPERGAEKAMRSRQLKVLAGDYFSSRFYQLLSQAGQVEMIRKISGAVCEVNRLKMTLYMKMKSLRVSAEEYVTQCIRLKSELFSVFGALVEERFSRLWPELLQGFTCCDVLLQELVRMDAPDKFHRSWGYWKVMQEGTEEERLQLAGTGQEDSFIQGLIAKYQLRAKLQESLSAAVEQVQRISARLESDKLVRELSGIGESILHPFASSAAAFNERR